MGKLLVVDDEVDLREILAEMINEEGIQVVTATDGEDAFTQIINDRQNKKEIYAVLTDINMPKLNGLDLLKK